MTKEIREGEVIKGMTNTTPTERPARQPAPQNPTENSNKK